MKYYISTLLVKIVNTQTTDTCRCMYVHSPQKQEIDILTSGLFCERELQRKFKKCKHNSGASVSGNMCSHSWTKNTKKQLNLHPCMKCVYVPKHLV